AHVRHDVGLETVDDAGPLAETFGALTVLDAFGEEHLHADADAEHGPPAREPPVDDPIAPRGLEPGHARSEGADAGHDEAVGSERGVEVGRELDLRADVL